MKTIWLDNDASLCVWSRKTKLLVQTKPVSGRETITGCLSNPAACGKTPTARCCTSQFKSCSKHGSFSCFVFVHVFMSLMWFFYPRASSGTLSQESKCGTPVIIISHLPFVYGRACMCMCAHRFRCKGIHNPPLEALHMYACMGV